MSAYMEIFTVVSAICIATNRFLSRDLSLYSMNKAEGSVDRHGHGSNGVSLWAAESRIQPCKGVTGWVSSPARNEFRQSRMRLGPAREKQMGDFFDGAKMVGQA